MRIGNAAVEQLQLDVYGEITGAMHHARKGRVSEHEHGIELEWALLEHLEKIWREPDEGIWEVRGSRQQFTHSKVMAWLAFDSAIKSCEQFGLKGPLDRWRAVRQEIHEDVCRNGFNPMLGSFVQFYGSDNLDASLLLHTARSDFFPPSDYRVSRNHSRHRARSDARRFRDALQHQQTDDGLPPGEGVFLPCSFWLADAYILSGRRDEAKAVESLLKIPNDLGLLSEEYDPAEKRLVGNFPQALSHVALLSTALALSRQDEPELAAKLLL